MSFKFLGYVVEPPRAGQANSPFTPSPNNFVSDSVAFDTVYPEGSEPMPRAEYLVLVLEEGLLADATFGWTKNEVVQRFDYDGREQRFKPLPGSSPVEVGLVSADINESEKRLKVSTPRATISPVAFAPYRLSVGDGSGTTLNTIVVSAFGSPVVGLVEILETTGQLNWNADDLATYEGQRIRFQRQNFYSFRESNGFLGAAADVLLLNPLPAPGQIPLVRLGFGLYLTAIEVADDASFSPDPADGTVEWSQATGRLKFNSAVEETEVFYDGVLMASDLSLPRQDLGTIDAPSNIIDLPPEGGDIVFRIPSGYQFPQVVRVETLDPTGQYGVVQVLSDGTVQFSSVDQTLHVGQPVEVVFGDLPIERGVSMRFFRTPVNLDGSDPTLKDVTNVYTTSGATLADPIVGSPQVFLPAVPIDDPSYPIAVRVEQGTGTFSPGDLPRLDVFPLPTSNGPTFGYVLDLPSRMLQYAQRKNNVLVTLEKPAGAITLPDPFLVLENFEAALETGVGTGVFLPLTLWDDALLDVSAGILSFTSTQGTLVAQGTGSFSGTTFQDVEGSFGSVEAGDLLVITSGAGKGVYTVSSVVNGTTVITDVAGVGTELYEILRGREILVDRFWQEAVLVDPNTKVERITQQGTVLLTQGIDYKIQAGFGLIEFKDRFLEEEEALITYAPLSADGTIQAPVEERAVFLVRGELAQDHPLPTNTVTFNPLGRTVAASPAPKVRRGGRPQDSTQVLVDAANSTITFLPDKVVTNALPHGSVVQPEERIYIDYYVYEAIGGEKSITVLSPPMSVAQVVLEDGATNFTAPGDQTLVFPPGHLLRVETERVYYIGTSSYDSSLDTTTVTLASGATFQDSITGPSLYVSSGPIRIQPAPSYPSYFVTELAAYDAVARGMNKVYIQGDRTSAFKKGTVLCFSDVGFQDFYEVVGAILNDSGKTEVTLSSNALQQYVSGTHILKTSVRPLQEPGAKTVITSMPPVLAQPNVLYRRVEGQIGEILSSPTDYTIDNTGQVVFAADLLPSEEIVLLYTGHRFVAGGLRVKASYTSVIAPDSSTNGLVGQVLKMDYSLYSPDSFFFRVETKSNFQAEVAKTVSDSARASAPSGGPNLSNSSSPRLHEQGRESIYFQEGHLANQDLVAQALLKYYNDAAHHLEDVLQDMDGRVVGQADGRFLFDGNLDNPPIPSPPLSSPAPQPPSTLSEVTNQIDDEVLLTPFPVDSTNFPTLVYKGTWIRAFEAGPFSRLYPTTRRAFGLTIAGLDTQAKVGDEIMDLGTKSLTSVSGLRRRSPRARILKPASVGETTLYTSTLSATNELLRPAFAIGQALDIIGEDGTPLFANQTPDLSPQPTITIASILSSPDRIVLNIPVTVDIPVGATVTAPIMEPLYGAPYMSVGRIYTPGLSYGANLEKGTVLFPIDMSAMGYPPPNSNERLQAEITYGNGSTSPTRFPALDGIALDDDGDESIPLVSPTFECELVQLEAEQEYVGTNGILRSPVTTAPYEGMGFLNAAKDIITISGSFPSPAPKIYDLVRITSGLNGATSYRRITAVTANTVQVDTPFAFQDAGFSFVITVSDTLASGTGPTVSISGSVLTDSAADFVSAGLRKGFTIVISAGASAGDRRQVVSFTATTITVDQAFTSNGANSTYRVDNALNTFDDLDALISSLATSKGVVLTNMAPPPPAREPVDSIIIAIETFFNHVTTNLLDPAVQTGTVNDYTLTGTTDFVLAGVAKGDLVYIYTGPNEGFYRVTDPSPTSTVLTVETPFPSAGSVSYYVLRPFGVSQKKTFDDLFSILTDAASYALDLNAFKTIVETTVPVVVPGDIVDPNMYANGIMPSDVAARSSAVDDRLSYLSDPAGPIAMVQNILRSVEKFYDKRFAWIDARVNLLNGFLPKQSRARADREKAEADLVNNLYKLLSVQGNG